MVNNKWLLTQISTLILITLAIQPVGAQPSPESKRIEELERAVAELKEEVARLKKQNAIRRAIFFDSAKARLPPAPWDVAFRLHPNIYEGETRIDLHVQALRPAAPFH